MPFLGVAMVPSNLINVMVFCTMCWSLCFSFLNGLNITAVCNFHVKIDPDESHVFFSAKQLMEYYEIVGKSRPLSAFFPTHADFFYS